jgi:hypothetical protein
VGIGLSGNRPKRESPQVGIGLSANRPKRESAQAGTADVLLRAFWDAFTAQDDVSLFVRTSMDGRATEELKVRLVQAALPCLPCLPCTRANAARGAKPLPASRPPAERRLSALLLRLSEISRAISERNRPRVGPTAANGSPS